MSRNALPLVLLAVLPVLLLPPPALAEEGVDWQMVTRIREEGMHNSQVMETLEHLTDRIGARLTGSPQMKEANDWTRQQLADWGLANAHLEGFEFGRGWSFSYTAVHMTAPQTVPLLALPEAWTPGTDGPVRGRVMRADVESEKDFEKYRGKLAGKILFLDAGRRLTVADRAPIERLTDEELAEIFEFPIPSEGREGWRERMKKRWRFNKKLNDFLVEEKVVATVSSSSRDAGLVRVMGGGSRVVGENPGVPGLVMAVEHFNWVLRLIGEEPGPADADGGPAGVWRRIRGADLGDDEEAKGEDELPEDAVPVELEIEVRARFYDDDPSAYNTIAEIPGTDPGAGVVMVGAHLDSWHGGTGATDNGAGCAVAMEAVRILQAIGVRPKRTIRIALWSGEEQGLLGSRAYVEQHFATVPRDDADPEQQDLPPGMRSQSGPVSPKPEHANFSAYFNLDNGSGKIRGVHAQENLGVGPIFEAWLEPFHDLGATTVTYRNTRSTDHMSFDAVGLPGFQFVQDGLDYATRTHHTNVDVLDHAEREDLVQASVVMASFLYHAAVRDEPLPRKPMPVFKPEEAKGKGHDDDE